MIKLQKSTFFNEQDTRERLCDFILSTDILSMGEQCRKFEEKFSARQGRRHSVYVNSGSSANLILVQALLNLGRLQPGDVVAVSALTWATNIMPIIQLGLVPHLVDCEVATLNVSPATLRQALDEQPAIKCLFLTNTLGFCDDILGISSICAERGILLLEDNCESLGSKVDGQLLGNFGVASTFSFFVGHHLSTIEGGMVCTDDPELASQLIMCRAHGWDRSLPPTVQHDLRMKNGIDDFYAKYTFYDLAFNVRPTEINGFIGNLQIEYWNAIVETRSENFRKFGSVAAGNPGLMPVRSEHMDLVSNFAMPVIVGQGEDVRRYKEAFARAEVEIRPMIAGNMGMQPFFRKYVSGAASRPNADYIHKNGFYFANNPELTADELELLAGLLRG